MRAWPLLLALPVLMEVASAAVAQTGDVRFGNLHSHTSYSDGSGTPAEAFAAACAVPNIDFFAITEHNHDKGDGKGDRHDGVLIFNQPNLYRGSTEALVETADRLDAPGRCVTLFGQEFSTISSGNHVNVFDVDQIIDAPSGKFDALLNWVSGHHDFGGAPPLLQFNHPGTGSKAVKDYGRDDFGGDEKGWVQAMAPHVSLIEVFNAPALRDGVHQRTENRSSLYLRYLNLGFHLAPSVGQDNHYRNWGNSTDARVAVISPSFTRRGIIDALRARHAYASEDSNLRVVFRSGGALQGDIVAPPAVGDELPLTVEIVDDDEPNAAYRIDVFKDVAGGPPASRPVESFEVTGNQGQPLALEGVRFEQAGDYVLLRITQLGEEDDEHLIDDQLWTAPIWFEPPGLHAPQELPRMRIVSLVPDPLGDDFVAEQITLRNVGSQSVSVVGWQVRDLAGNTWILDGLGEFAAGQTKTIVRNGQAMSLNNGGDEIELVSPDGSVAQSVTYGKVASGGVIEVDGN